VGGVGKTIVKKGIEIPVLSLKTGGVVAVRETLAFHWQKKTR